MNTAILLALEEEAGLDAAANTLLEEGRRIIEEFEQRFSRFLPGSELSRLNASGGQWMEVSDDMLDLLMLSKAYFEETSGLFDPAVLRDLKRVGYDVSMDVVRRRGDLQRPAQARGERALFSAVEFDAEHGRVKLPDGLEVDLGGIAKGWIAQRVAERMRSLARGAAVSAGGDMFFAGSPAASDRWRVEIADPRNEESTLAVLQVREGAVVTSSISKRAWKQGGQERHHIIDPRTGEPAQSEWLSVTVVAPRADLAEAYAKALLIGGPTEAPQLMLQRPRLAVISVGRDGQILASQNSREYLSDSHQQFQ